MTFSPTVRARFPLIWHLGYQVVPAVWAALALGTPVLLQLPRGAGLLLIPGMAGNSGNQKRVSHPLQSNPGNLVVTSGS